MRDMERDFTKGFVSFGQTDVRTGARGLNDWAVPWSDLMMVMFVLFVVLFIYASTHQDVKVLFSEQSAGEAQATSTLDPLMGLIGQIAKAADGGGQDNLVRTAGNKVLYRSRTDGVSIVSEGADRVRIAVRGELFFDAQEGTLKPESTQYLEEIAELVRLSLGRVHVVGYSARNEASGASSFTLSTDRATDVAEYLITHFGVEPKRIIISGRGAYMPELPGTSNDNMAMNRRVEIVITNTI